MIIVALCVAAAVAVPIQDEESLEVSVEQTQEFGIIKKAWNHVFKKDVSEADVSCKMENRGGCETKYRTGRRLLEAEAEDAAVAKKAYEDQQALISNLAKALSDEKHGETQDAEAEAKVVAREVKEDGEAKDDEKKATALMAKATKEFHQAGAALADAKKDVAQDAKETAAARAHQKSEAARFAARVAAAKKRLADAQGALGGLHAAHMKEAGEAAHAKSQ